MVGRATMEGGAVQMRLVLDTQDQDEERTEDDLQYLLGGLVQIDGVSIERESAARPRRVRGAPGWMPPARY